MTSLLAISDLHIGYQENRRIVEELRPVSDSDWLLVAGDVSEKVSDVEWALRLLGDRFEKVVWAPGNHELWTHPSDPVQLRGEERYRHLVEMCRNLGVVTPEDPYPIWTGPGGPVTVAPLFVLYDYTFRMPGVTTKEEALALAYDRAWSAPTRCCSIPTRIPPGTPGARPGSSRRSAVSMILAAHLLCRVRDGAPSRRCRPRPCQ